MHKLTITRDGRVLYDKQLIANWDETDGVVTSIRGRRATDCWDVFDVLNAVQKWPIHSWTVPVSTPRRYQYIPKKTPLPKRFS